MASARRVAAVADPPILRRALIGAALAFVGVFLAAPLAVILTEAFRRGFGAYAAAVTDPAALAALRLTLLSAGCAVALNLVFGLAAAWALAKHDFRGKAVVLTLIDVPFAISPVISGLMFVMIFGRHGLLGPFLAAHGWRLLFTPAAIVLATSFVTLPFVARELIPLMESQGAAEEEAALTLGASGWQTFRLVTLPNVKWGALYGVILLNARAMGEYGAVSIVSGHIQGLTNTLPLHVEALYNEYETTAAFAVASLLAAMALAALAARGLISWGSDEH